jgi:hypothetical protein
MEEYWVNIVEEVQRHEVAYSDLGVVEGQLQVGRQR